MTNLIYGLIDPRTSLVRYVGKSVNGLARPRAHAGQSRTDDTYRSRWIKALRKAGFAYEIVVLEQAETKEALSDLERWWIAYARACAWPLTNLTDGGEGTPGRRATDETRARMSAAQKGHPGSMHRLGTHHTPEVREKIAAALRGRKGIKPTPDTIAKRVATRRASGYTHTPEAREKMAAGHRGKKLSAEHRANIGAASAGRKHTPETRAKMVASWAKRKAAP